MDRLRSWLEVDRGVDFAALGFLYEVLDQISLDGIVAEEELDRLALAIERVLPKPVRLAATQKRKEVREQRRVAKAAAQIEARAVARAGRERAKVLDRARFVVRGAFRSAERREACEALSEGDNVILDREPENRHDRNAILVLSTDDCELGYVPREDAKVIAPLLDAGAHVEAIIDKLWETPDDGHTVPIVVAKFRSGDFVSPPAERVASPVQRVSPPPEAATPPAQPIALGPIASAPDRAELKRGPSGGTVFVWMVVLVLLALGLMFLRSAVGL